MRYARFRDPAGAVRRGTYHPDANAVSFGGDQYDLSRNDITLIPPCEPTKLVCVGRNYADHAAEMGNELPERPLLFLKGPNTVAPPGATITLPADKRVDHEVELAVVIEEQCRNVSAAEAMDVVAGFTCLNDVSNRDDQERESQWVRGKAFDGAAPIGPAIADPGHVPADARVELRVNGETRQASSRDNLAFSVQDLIAEITEYATLEPGDIIATGTPAGVGPLSDGDDVAIEIEGVGVLEHDVRRA